MSNEEKLMIENYKKKRKKVIFIQAIIVGLLSIILVVLFGAYRSVNQVSYINYNETSSINYKVGLVNNDLYEEDELGEDYAYVTSLIKDITADINYKVAVEAENVEYEYAYQIDAKVVIIDKTTNKEIYKPVYPLVEQKKSTTTSNKLSISETIVIDYNKYNAEVVNFVSTLNLTSASSKLVISTKCNVISQCDSIASAEANTHTFDLVIPLNETVIKITESNTGTNEPKVLACEKVVEKNALRISMIIVGALDILSIIGLLVYTLSTRNNHINYSNKIARIVKSYKSFIQKINNSFDTSSYQVLYVDTLNELLEIRDTLQSPILMDENEDRTMTKFIIPAANNLLYVHVIKIENYDEIYSDGDDGNTPLVDHQEEEIVIDEPIIEVEESSNEVEEDEEAEENKFDFGFNYSFEAKLVLSNDEVRGYYQDITQFVKEYGIKITRSFKKERVHLGRKHIATMIFRGKKLCILFPLNPNKEEYSKYHFVDVSEYKKYSDTPAMMRVTSSRKVKYAIELIHKLCIENNIVDKNLVIKETKIKSRSKKSLINEGLIKVNN